MMSTKHDAQLNKAALLIAKLLLRTREGKVAWTHDDGFGPQLGNILGERRYIAKLDDGMEVALTSNERQLCFELSGPPVASTLPAPQALSIHPEEAMNALFGDRSKILSVSLSHSFRNIEELTPESIVYKDLEELIQLAQNPKSVSDDLRYKQALSYLDKLTA